MNTKDNLILQTGFLAILSVPLLALCYKNTGCSRAVQKGIGQGHSFEPVLILVLCQGAECAAIIRRDFLSWQHPENGFCLMVNPSADLMLSAKEGAAPLLVCTNASMFTTL